MFVVLQFSEMARLTDLSKLLKLELYATPDAAKRNPDKIIKICERTNQLFAFSIPRFILSQPKRLQISWNICLNSIQLI